MKTILKKKDKPKEQAVTAAGERGMAAYFRDPVDRSYILRLCVTLLTITVVAALLLGLTYYVTEPQITRRTREKTEEAMRSVLLAESYEELEFTPVDGVTAISAAKNGESVVGYVCQVDSNGFGGTMSMVVGVDAGGYVTGVKVVKHSETKNIGTKVVESQEVLDHFVGLSGEITLNEGDNRFDGVSGATYSSKGVLAGVNAALAAVAAYLG